MFNWVPKTTATFLYTILNFEVICTMSRAFVLKGWEWHNFAPQRTFGSVWRHFWFSQPGEECSWPVVIEDRVGAK